MTAAEIVQVVGAAGDIELERVDLGSLPSKQREANLQRQMAERSDRAFDLATGPVLRATLYRLAPDEHVLVPLCNEALEIMAGLWWDIGA